MSFALDKKKEKESFRRHFKDALDDCFNLERAVMISSQLPFVLFFFLKIQVHDKDYLDVHFS